jgi:alpha-D-xyloside xylohydrolase
MLTCKYMENRDPQVVSWESTGDRLRIRTIRYSDETDTPGILELIPLRNSLVRVRYTESAFDEQPSISLVPVEAQAEWSVEESEDCLHVRTGSLEARVTKATSRIEWLTADGEPVAAETEDRGKWLKRVAVERMKWSADTRLEIEETADGLKQRLKGKGTRVFDRHAYESTLRFQLAPGEAIYGLGQHENGIFDYSCREEFLYQANMKVAIPTFLSNRGYAIHQDQHCFAHVTGDGEAFTFWSEAVPQLDYFFIYGPEFDDLVRGVRLLTGTPPMLPRWAYGFVQSKERYESAEELLSVARRFREEEVPLDCIVLDWSSWVEGQWGQKSLDPARFPDPEGMMKQLHAMNVRLMISIWPNMQAGGPDQCEFEKAGLLMANQTTYDSSRPEARNLYWKQAESGLFSKGIDAWWCDCTEPFEVDWSGSQRQPAWRRAVTCTEEFRKFMDPARINAFSLEHSQGIYEGQRASGSNKRVVNLTRSAGPSQQRYGTITWSGDVEARWSRLRKQLADGLNFVMTGNPRWTFDIGGFFTKPGVQWFWDGQYPTGNADLGYRELYTRWFQTGCFLPMFRSHGTDTAREIWNFGEPGTVFHDTIKAFTELRYRLLPYIYSLAAMEVFNGYTMFRSLLFDFRDDSETHRIADQFMLGPALMVCPVLEPMRYGPHSKELPPGRQSRRVYLPGGTDWYDFWSRERLSGGQWIEAPAPLERLPVFVPAGSILPMGPVVQHSGEGFDAPWEVHVFTGKDAAFDIYEDDGDGYAYEQGAFAWTRLDWDDRTRKLSIRDSRGAFNALTPEREIRQHLHAGS